MLDETGQHVPEPRCVKARIALVVLASADVEDPSSPLATVIDAQSRKVIGWALAEHMRASLVTEALTMAVVQRGHSVAGVIFHSDRGVQHNSGALRQLAREHDVLLSVGRTGVTPCCFWQDMRED